MRIAARATLLAVGLFTACDFEPTAVVNPTDGALAPDVASFSHVPTASVLLATDGHAIAGLSTLYELDPNTGATIRTIGPVGYIVNGMDFDPVTGTLYGSTSVRDPNFQGLITIDPSTGAGTRAGLPIWGRGGTVHNITADARGRLYGWRQPGSDLVEIRKLDGTASVVGNAGVNTITNGLDFAPSGTLYMVNGDGRTYSVNPRTGAASFLFDVGPNARHGDFDPATGLYYGFQGTPQSANTPINVLDMSAGTIVATHNTDRRLTVLTFIPATNDPPTADAGADQTVECTDADDGTTTVTLDGTGSSDPDGSIASYEWSIGGNVIVTGANPTLELSHGPYTITLTVTDDDGDTDTDVVVIDIVDTAAPSIAFALSQTTLWPPKYQMVTVATGVGASDLCDANPVVDIVVTSDEPVNGIGDGNTSPDWVVTDNGDGTFDVAVRAERAGNGDGRVYTIAVTATDAAGNVASTSGEVKVPHNQGRDGPPGPPGGGGRGPR